jgi:hypothetical protein
MSQMKAKRLESLLHDWAAHHTGDARQRETVAEGIRRQFLHHSSPATPHPFEPES